MRRSVTSLLAVCAISLCLACGPIGPLAGGRLRGTVRPPPSSWESFAAVKTAQLETQPTDPHSINVWLGVVDGQAYLSTSLIMGPDDPAERAWVRHVERDPRVRLRIEGDVYELIAERVDDAALADRVRDAMIEKYGVEADAHSNASWIFRLSPRPAATDTGA